MSSRTKILSKVKNALSNKLEYEDSPLFDESVLRDKISATIPASRNKLIEKFEEELRKVNAEFLNVNSVAEIPQKLISLFEEMKEVRIATTYQKDCLEVKSKIEKMSSKYHFLVANDYSSEDRKENISKIGISIVQADYAISEIGSLIFCYDNSKTSYPHFLCDFVIALVHVDKLLPNQFKLFDVIDSEKSKNMVFVAGPSRTADIEKVLVLGAHGPRRLLVILIDDED